MRFEHVRVEDVGSGDVELRALGGGEPLCLRIPAARLHRPAIGDALVLSALVPSMVAGTPLRLPDDVPVSARLMAELPGIQRIYRTWNMRLAEVEVEARACEPVPDGTGVALFYAGGVDSSYSLIAHEREIDALVTVFGFDITMSDEEIAASTQRNRAFAQRLGLGIHFAASNHRAFLRAHGVSRTFVFGAMLASIALLCGFRRCYIASSHSAGHLRPEGSHPVLDGRYSNGTTAIVHDDVSVSRLAKTRAIARRPDVLDNLRVCWDYPNDNCGACLKCLRTMVALRLCDASGPFPPLALGRVAWMAANTELDYIVEMAVAAKARGDARLLRLLRRGLRRHDLEEALRHLVYAATGRKLHYPRWLKARQRPLTQFDARPDLGPG